MDAFGLLSKEFGPQNWWPGETPFEVMVGAVLTQNTNWGNVEKAINNLKAQGLLEAKKIDKLGHPQLAALIRPAGYYNIKSRRLKNFVTAYIRDFDGEEDRLRRLDLDSAREWLLSINGIGFETADSILLYALDKSIFVVDAYTKRILLRHKFVPEEASYHEIQELFMDNLNEDPKLFNEYHALIVMCGKNFCKKSPLCEKCPLKKW